MKTVKPLTPVQFFRKHAGFSYNPSTETKAQGKTRCARELAQSEQWARDHGVSFAWSIDPDSDSSSFSDARPCWNLWQCAAHDAAGNVSAYLGAIDFGRKGSPHSDPYRRVVEAELAQEIRANLETVNNG